jgi:hypothetical protein
LSQPIREHTDQRLVELTQMAEYMEAWWVDNQSRMHSSQTKAELNASFFTREFYFDFRLSCRSVVGFCHYHLEQCEPGEGIALRWLNQDPAEGLFAEYRAQLGNFPQMGAAALPGIMGSVRARQVDRSATTIRKGQDTTIPYDEQEVATLAAADALAQGHPPEPEEHTHQHVKAKITRTNRLMTKSKNTKITNVAREAGREVAAQAWPDLPMSAFSSLKKRAGQTQKVSGP